MVHGLLAVGAAVDYEAVSRVGNALLPGDLGGDEEQMPQQRLILSRGVGDAGKMRPRLRRRGSG